MGIPVARRVADLGEGLVLAPERFDPRRQLGGSARRRKLGDLADVVAVNVSAASAPRARSVLILDTTHAYDGFVILRHDPVAWERMGSMKRLLAPGDVVVSRLRPYLRQIAYVDAPLFALAAGGNAVVASAEFFVLRGRGGFAAPALVPYLLSRPVQAALAAAQEGGHHPRFSKEALISLSVPETIVKTAAKTARSVQALAGAVRASLGSCRELVARVERVMEESLEVDISD